METTTVMLLIFFVILCLFTVFGFWVLAILHEFRSELATLRHRISRVLSAVTTDFAETPMFPSETPPFPSESLPNEQR